MNSIAFLAVSFLLTIVLSVMASPFEKKADIATFTSAINGAGRLRYGKRSSAQDWEDYAPVENQYLLSGRGYPFMNKRGLNTDLLVASLNGAERLRFGRK